MGAENWGIPGWHSWFSCNSGRWYFAQEAVKEFVQLLNYGMLPRGQVFTMMNREMRHQAVVLFRVLYSAKTFDVFYHTAVWARFNVNELMYVYSLSVAMIHRPDTRMMKLPPMYEVVPHFFFNDDVMQRTYNIAMGDIGQSLDSVLLHSVHSFFASFHKKQQEYSAVIPLTFTRNLTSLTVNSWRKEDRRWCRVLCTSGQLQRLVHNQTQPTRTETELPYRGRWLQSFLLHGQPRSSTFHARQDARHATESRWILFLHPQTIAEQVRFHKKFVRLVFLWKFLPFDGCWNLKR